MSNHTNYNRMYNADEIKNETVETLDAHEVDFEPEIDITPETTVETATENAAVVENEESTSEVEPETLTGKVVNCTRLNVRKNPDANAKVLCVIQASEEVEVEVVETIGWYHVRTASGVEGYCVAQYIET